MLEVLKDFSLRPYNTFGIAAQARYFLEARTVDDLTEVLGRVEYQSLRKLWLGGGSNVLFTDDYEGLVVKNGLLGIELIGQDDTHVWVKAGAGEVWHDLVLYCIGQGWGGVENLSLIPGTVGAAPLQNIGAYGVELKDVFHQLSALRLDTGKVETFDAPACQFGYRDSVFKNTAKDQYVVVSVTLRLAKRPEFNTDYGAIRDTLARMGNPTLTPAVVGQAVTHIRQSKLPDPDKVGNAGSFFKNPVLEEDDFRRLKGSWADIPGYSLPDGRVKVPAAWLIEQCGWKGKTFGAIGVYPKQPLVLVNYGGGTGKELWALAQKVMASVLARFGVALQPEVNVL